MMSRVNECIECSVAQCQYHSNDRDYCTLDVIRVGTHEMNPTQDQCTDCQSFKLRG